MRYPHKSKRERGRRVRVFSRRFFFFCCLLSFLSLLPPPALAVDLQAAGAACSSDGVSAGPNQSGQTVICQSGTWAAAAVPPLLYSNTTQKSGDTVTNSVAGAEIAFASSYTAPANYFTANMKCHLTFDGYYTTPSVLSPTTVAKIYIGSTLVLATPALGNPIGASGLGYSGYADITFPASIGTTTAVRASGTLIFATTSLSAVNIVVPAAASAATINTTVSNVIKLAPVFAGSNATSASNTNTLSDLSISCVAPISSN